MQAWFNHIDKERPLYCLQALGLLEGTSALADIDEVIADYTDRIIELVPHGPYNLVGWSFGGVVAHKLATALQKTEQERGPTLHCRYLSV